MIPKKNLVLYSINQSPLHIELCLISLESLRKQSPSVKVKVSHFGKIPSHKIRKFKKLGAELIEHPPVSSEHRFGLKWPALVDARDYRNILVIDADTFFFAPVEPLFAKNSKKAIIANIEYASAGDYLRGPHLIKMRFDQKLVRKIKKKFNLAEYPIFNSSVMLFNNFSHHKVIERLPNYFSFFIDFHRGELPYPASLWFILEQVCGSFTLSIKPKLAYGNWNIDQVTPFHEWYHSKNKVIGPLMHYGSIHAMDFFKRFEMKSNLQRCYKANELLKKQKYKFVGVDSAPWGSKLLPLRHQART